MFLQGFDLKHFNFLVSVFREMTPEEEASLDTDPWGFLTTTTTTTTPAPVTTPSRDTKFQQPSSWSPSEWFEWLQREHPGWFKPTPFNITTSIIMPKGTEEEAGQPPLHQGQGFDITLVASLGTVVPALVLVAVIFGLLYLKERVSQFSF
jgi:hypothetical protein